jgi:uncharacterized protein (DUF433 family)
MSPVTTDPETMHGTPCFTGTRVPVKTLFDYLARGHSADDFLAGFPTVTRDQVLAVLEIAEQSLTQARAQASAK